MPMNDQSQDRRASDMMQRLMQESFADSRGKQLLPNLVMQEVAPKPDEPNIETHILCTCGCAIRHENQHEVYCQKCGLLWLWEPDQDCWYMGTVEPTPEQLAELDRRARRVARAALEQPK